MAADLFIDVLLMGIEILLQSFNDIHANILLLIF
jgi:hypothetical protein